ERFWEEVGPVSGGPPCPALKRRMAPGIKKSPKRKPERVALVTGTLAEPGLRRIAGELSQDRKSATGQIEAHVGPRKIQVAALMTAEWVARNRSLPPGLVFNRVILPGHCRGEPALVQSRLGGTPVELGPLDMRDLAQYLGRPAAADGAAAEPDIQIIAE